MKKIVFDLDGTICEPNLSMSRTEDRYGKAKPVKKVIDKMKDLQYNGYYIVIHTARRMVTHNGDLDKIIADVGTITENWLDEHDVPYNELIFGKPYSDTHYVDDKAMNIEQFIEWEIE